MELDVWPIIKWVLIILLAGFIGQFGKIVADEIVARARSKHKKDPSTDSDPALTATDSEKNTTAKTAIEPLPISNHSPIKLDKKAAKAMAKQMKKAAKK
jgi:hypothetical protein